MSTVPSLLVVASLLWLPGTTFAQEPAADAADSKAETTAGSALFLPGRVSDLLQMAVELRKAGESLEQFGESLTTVSATAAAAAGSTSQNLAALGGEFDPFGFKTAFQTIQQQNIVIQNQHELIIEMQRKEIRRLKQQVRQSGTAHRTRRRTGKSRPRRPARPQKHSEPAAPQP